MRNFSSHNPKRYRLKVKFSSSSRSSFPWHGPDCLPGLQIGRGRQAGSGYITSKHPNVSTYSVLFIFLPAATKVLFDYSASALLVGIRTVHFAPLASPAQRTKGPRTENSRFIHLLHTTTPSNSVRQSVCHIGRISG